MNAIQYAIITTANAMRPEDDGYQAAQRWKAELVTPEWGAGKRAALDDRAEQMRNRYLNSGTGCKTRAKAIAERTGGPPEPPHLPR